MLELSVGANLAWQIAAYEAAGSECRCAVLRKSTSPQL